MMKTFYLVDFENVNNGGIKNIGLLSKKDHVYIFSTKNAKSIRLDLALPKNTKVSAYIVPSCKQSNDMHIVSYLGYLIAKNGKKCAYRIISHDNDYNNIIQFWKNEGCKNIKKDISIKDESKSNSTKKQVKKFIAFMRNNLAQKDYDRECIDIICGYLKMLYGRKTMMSDMHTELQHNYENFTEIYHDIKAIKAEYDRIYNKN